MYNINETGVMLSMPSSVKVLINKYNKQDYKDIRVKRTSVTAIEYINSDSKYLNLIIIWLTSTY
jgi:hypothetical protein